MIDGKPTGVLIVPDYPPNSEDLAKFSHLGGVPMLPPGTEWPRGHDNAALHFVGQIDLSDLPSEGIVDHRGNALSEFPRDGAFCFFADCATYGLWENPDAAHRVLYLPGDTAAYHATPPPPDLLAHNSPKAAVVASTHSPHFPKLCPRPLVKLPHVPLSFLDASAMDLPPGKIGGRNTRPPHGLGTSYTRTGRVLDYLTQVSRGAGLCLSGSQLRYTQLAVTTNLGRALYRVLVSAGLKVLL